MNEKEMYRNECAKIDEFPQSGRDELKRLEISEAIKDIDNKLTDLEMALHMHDNNA